MRMTNYCGENVIGVLFFLIILSLNIACILILIFEMAYVIY